MNKLIAIILLWLSTSVTAGKGKGMGRSMSGMMMMGSSSKSKSGKGKGKGKGYYPDNYYYYYYPEIVFPPYGSNAIDLPKYPDWVVYAALANRIGVANAESPPADLSGALSYGIDSENPVFLDEAGTFQGGSFSFTSTFVGETTVPAIITAALTVYDETGTEIYGRIFCQGMQNEDFSADLAIVGGSGNYVGVSGQVMIPPLSSTGLVPIAIYFF